MRTSLIVSILLMSSFSYAGSSDVVIPTPDECSPSPIIVPEGHGVVDPVMCEARCITDTMRLTNGMGFGEVYAYCSDLALNKMCVSRERSSANRVPLLYPTLERNIEYGFFVGK